MGARIIGFGHKLPEKIMHNQEFEQLVDTSDQWIQERTGICRRHVASPQETTSFLAAQAAAQALHNAGVSPESLDFILVATTTADHVFPSTAARVQGEIGAVNGFGFDVQAVCSGFLYALSVAHHFFQGGRYKRGLVIGSEVMSKLLDWSDRSTCVLFGDGAGALLLEGDDNPDQGILGVNIHTDGRLYDAMYVPGPQKIHMNGREIFRHGTQKMALACREILAQSNLSIGDVNWFVPHQANQRMIKTIGEELGIHLEKTALSVKHHANTSAASIPLALYDLHEKALLKKDDLILMAAAGAGFTWGSGLMRV